ncbi:MAG TPA: MAPEG family protein [Alphaproteobacteria bacterium]
MTITGLYAGILALLFLVLSAHVVMGRFQFKTPFGDGGNGALNRRIRIHGNFAEYVPLALILMGILDYQQTSVTLLHVLGITLVIARILHAIALTADIFPLRVAGVVGTFAVIGIEAVLTISHYLL